MADGPLRAGHSSQQIAGKTGTSQLFSITAAERAAGIRAQTDLPWNRRDHALFVAYAPYHAPRVSVTVVVEHGGGGSTIAAPIARDIVLFALHGGIPPAEDYPVSQRNRILQDFSRLSQYLLPPHPEHRTISRTKLHLCRAHRLVRKSICTFSKTAGIHAGAAHQDAALGGQNTAQHAFKVVLAVRCLLICLGAEHGIGHHENRGMAFRVMLGQCMRHAKPAETLLSAIGRVAQDQQEVDGTGPFFVAGFRRGWVSSPQKNSSAPEANIDSATNQKAASTAPVR